MYPTFPSDPPSPPIHQAGTSSAKREAAADETSLALTHAGGEDLPSISSRPTDHSGGPRSTGPRCRRPYARRSAVHIWNVEPQELRDACPIAWTRLRPLTGGSRWTRRRRSSESCRRSAGASVERPLPPLRPQAGRESPTSNTPETATSTAQLCWMHIEVFSPGIHSPLKAAVDAAGRPAASRQGLRARLLGTGSRQAALDARPAHGADLQRCLSCPSVDGESR
jgi:hypothetical protein